MIFVGRLVPIVVLSSIHAIVLIFYNVSMYFIYKFKIPFFEKYRINNVKPMITLISLSYNMQHIK